ncbi:MAG: host-nuclease inhibitor Gam family protein [Bacteroidetes bacterium]|nr:host-nuclease inhibitor Gam family protein [Bacteroidota bacterium]
MNCYSLSSPNLNGDLMSGKDSSAQVLTSFDESNIHSIEEAKSLIKPLSDKEMLEEIINSMGLDEGFLTDNLKEASPEVQLDTYLYVIRKKEEELLKYQQIATETIARTEKWLEGREKNISSSISYLSNRLRYYLKSNNLKSLSLPNGVIGLRKLPKKLEISDEELFFRDANPDFLKHHPESYEPDLQAIKNFINKANEIPKGVIVKSQEPKFYYKLSEQN